MLTVLGEEERAAIVISTLLGLAKYSQYAKINAKCLTDFFVVFYCIVDNILKIYLCTITQTCTSKFFMTPVL